MGTAIDCGSVRQLLDRARAIGASVHRYEFGGVYFVDANGTRHVCKAAQAAPTTRRPWHGRA